MSYVHIFCRYAGITFPLYIYICYPAVKLLFSIDWPPWPALVARNAFAASSTADFTEDEDFWLRARAQAKWRPGLG